MTTRHWLRTPSDEDPEPYSEDECRYCEEVRRENAQVVEINAALHDALYDAVKALKVLRSVVALSGIEMEIALADAAITDAEIILGEQS